MQDILDAVRREAARVVSRLALPRKATVSSYDPSSHAVKVKLQPEGYETGWAPLATPQAGNGWGIHSPPEPGQQVLVLFEDGHLGSPVVVGSLYSDADRPTVSDVGGEGEGGAGGSPAGETWLANKSGARVRLLNDGTVEVRAKAGTKVVLHPDGSVDVQGTEIRVGAEGATLQTLVRQEFQALYDNHTHPGNGQAPTQKMTPAHLTTALKAG